jgi:hypothetical protein
MNESGLSQNMKKEPFFCANGQTATDFPHAKIGKELLDALSRGWFRTPHGLLSGTPSGCRGSSK